MSFRDPETANQANPPALSVSSVIADLDSGLSSFADLLKRATLIADNFVGGTPRDAGAAGKDAPEPSALLQRVSSRANAMHPLAARLNDQLDRIARGLGVN
jgi:hypothetical protein